MEKPGAKIWFTEDMKLNMGDFQSVGVSAGITLDVLPNETPAAAFKRARGIVSKELRAEARRVRNGKYGEELEL